jgi:CRISPR-associated Csx2 family protein
MPRNIFLSFLGTGNYEAVSYYPEAKRQKQLPGPVKYVQQALLQELSGHFRPEDHAFIFLTEEARAANWEDDGHENYKTREVVPNTGLKKRIEQAALSFPVSPVDIDGESEEDKIWNTFLTVYDCLEEGDRVYLDITHSWRYLPMLGMALLNYAKALKKIEVKAIYYGALERLAPLHEVRSIPEDQRPVPILNLVSFSEMQDWAAAADDFVRYGNADRWNFLTNQKLSPFLKASGEKDQVTLNINTINRSIKKILPLLQTNRGMAFFTASFDELKEALDHFSAEENYVKPLTPIVEKVREKMTPLIEESSLKWLEGVRWCIDHGLVQQGITQLQEGLLSWLCLYLQKQGIAPDFFDWTKESPRTLLSSVLSILPDPPPEQDWRGPLGQKRQLSKTVMQFPIILNLAPVYQSLSSKRNDINHGGYTRTGKSTGFSEILRKNFEQIEAIISPEAKALETSPAGLLNLSNHPAKGWSESQLDQAQARFGEVKDLPFPTIDPEWSDTEISELVSEYFAQILQLRPRAVHLMGEMTFTFALVHRLQSIGIPCLASTTERIVLEEKDGKKTMQFRFVQFRPYPKI